MSRRRPPVASLLRRRCLITGAASGIGRATSLAAAGRGAALHLTDLDAAGLAETARLVEARGGTVLTAEPLDITGDDRPAHPRRLGADDRRRPARPDLGAGGLRPVDDRGRAWRPRRQRLLRRGAARTSLARGLQRRQVRAQGCL